MAERRRQTSRENEHGTRDRSHDDRRPAERPGTQGYGESRFHGSPYESGNEKPQQRGDYWDEDGAGQGRHRGVGPKGYSRRDDRVHDDVCDALTEDEHLDASGIEVSVKDGEVTLTGTVGNRQDKRHAEDLADRAAGVKHVQNNLRVRDAASRD